MKPNATMWRICMKAALASGVTFAAGCRLDEDEARSEAAMVFMSACEKWQAGTLSLKDYFLMQYRNRLIRLKRNEAIRNRILHRTRKYDVAYTHARTHPVFDRDGLMDKLDRNERKLLEVVLNYDQRRIRPNKKRADHWPVGKIMTMARRKMSRWGWDQAKMQRVVRGIREVLLEARSA